MSLLGKWRLGVSALVLRVRFGEFACRFVRSLAGRMSFLFITLNRSRPDLSNEH
jgi:hypothetical protein